MGDPLLQVARKASPMRRHLRGDLKERGGRRTERNQVGKKDKNPLAH